MTAEVFRYIEYLRRQLKGLVFEESAQTGSEQATALKRIEELVDLYEFSPAGYLNLDKNARIQTGNMTATHMLGVPSEELIGQSLYPFVIREDRDILFVHLKELFKEKKPKSCELKIKGLSGKPRWARLDSLYNDKPPRPPQSRTTLLDIDEQKQTQTKLALMAAIVQALDDAVLRQDPDGIITHWNPAAEKIFGYSSAEAVGQSIELIIPEKRRGEGRELIRRIRRGEKILGWETVRRAKDGREIDIALTLSAMTDERGRLTAVASIGRDISELIRTRRRLNRVREELQMATQAARIGTWFANPGRGTSQWNEQLYRLLGLDPRPGPEDMNYFFSFIHPDDRRGFLQNARAVMDRGGDEIEKDFRIIRADGEIRWMTTRGKIFRDASGDPLYMAGINFDITDVKAARQAEQLAQLQLSDNVAQLQQRNEELDQFVYAASHDLKAPLRAICNYSDFLNEDLAESLSGEQKRYLEGLKTAATQGQNLIDDLLAYARIGRTSTQTENVDVPALINEVKSFLNLSSDIGLTLQKDWPVLETDPLLLSQILKNLVANAVKFNRSASKKVDIGWNQIAKNGSIEIFVRDNGVGIDPRYHKQIFGIFQRLQTSREYDGTGIGLAVVKKAVTELGGEVRVESTPGGGSTFFVELPYKVE
jgi:PAS domain S-box-containing protein